MLALLLTSLLVASSPVADLDLSKLELTPWPQDVPPPVMCLPPYDGMVCATEAWARASALRHRECGTLPGVCRELLTSYKVACANEARDQRLLGRLEGQAPAGVAWSWLVALGGGGLAAGLLLGLALPYMVH